MFKFFTMLMRVCLVAALPVPGHAGHTACTDTMSVLQRSFVHTGTDKAKTPCEKSCEDFLKGMKVRGRAKKCKEDCQNLFPYTYLESTLIDKSDGTVMSQFLVCVEYTTELSRQQCGEKARADTCKAKKLDEKECEQKFCQPICETGPSNSNCEDDCNKFKYPWTDAKFAACVRKSDGSRTSRNKCALNDCKKRFFPTLGNNARTRICKEHLYCRRTDFSVDPEFDVDECKVYATCRTSPGMWTLSPSHDQCQGLVEDQRR